MKNIIGMILIGVTFVLMVVFVEKYITGDITFWRFVSEEIILFAIGNIGHLICDEEVER